MENRPWEEAKREFEDEVLPILERLGRAIGRHALEGDKTASRIVELYHQLYRSFDPMTAILIREALDEYRRQRQTE